MVKWAKWADDLSKTVKLFLKKKILKLSFHLYTAPKSESRSVIN